VADLTATMVWILNGEMQLNNFFETSGSKAWPHGPHTSRHPAVRRSDNIFGRHQIGSQASPQNRGTRRRLRGVIFMTSASPAVSISLALAFLRRATDLVPHSPMLGYGTMAGGCLLHRKHDIAVNVRSRVHVAVGRRNHFPNAIRTPIDHT